MLRHYDQDERESDGSKHWVAVKSFLLRKLDRDESEISMMKCGYKRSLKAAPKQGWSVAKK